MQFYFILSWSSDVTHCFPWKLSLVVVVVLFHDMWLEKSWVEYHMVSWMLPKWSIPRMSPAASRKARYEGFLKVEYLGWFLNKKNHKIYLQT